MAHEGAAARLWAKLRAAQPFFLIAGPNVIESREHCLRMADMIQSVTSRLGIEFIFKSSFDKANRTSASSFRGPGLLSGLEILAAVKSQIGVPVLTDIHEAAHAAPVAEVADLLQIPAFLCRQTDLIAAAARTGRIIHVKKGQWCEASVLSAAAHKAALEGNEHVISCERGTAFGYSDLIVDTRNLVWMRRPNGLVTADVTHALQLPGGVLSSTGARSAGGLREMIPTVARAAAAVGVDGIFMEVHDDPLSSPCDSATQWPLRHLPAMLSELSDIAKASRGHRDQYPLDALAGPPDWSFL
ncbi:hypothetical protein AB1Y20_016710 [Prymnesium parvum]|uniref:3-deoxy-8-phosphooctulonate synthase n=1 Tax=Prymnesium parvum TaxID=97485 RepID=A0AB34I8K2_PRYPA